MESVTEKGGSQSYERKIKFGYFNLWNGLRTYIGEFRQDEIHTTIVSPGVKENDDAFARIDHVAQRRPFRAFHRGGRWDEGQRGDTCEELDDDQWV